MTLSFSRSLRRCVLGQLCFSLLADLFPLLVQFAGHFQLQGFRRLFQLALFLAQLQFLLPEGLEGFILFLDGPLQLLELIRIFILEFFGRLLFGLCQALF